MNQQISDTSQAELDYLTKFGLNFPPSVKSNLSQPNDQPKMEEQILQEKNREHQRLNPLTYKGVHIVFEEFKRGFRFWNWNECPTPGGILTLAPNNNHKKLLDKMEEEKQFLPFFIDTLKKNSW